MWKRTQERCLMFILQHIFPMTWKCWWIFSHRAQRSKTEFCFHRWNVLMFIVFCISICKKNRTVGMSFLFSSTFLRHAADKTLKYEIMNRSANNRWWWFLFRKSQAGRLHLNCWFYAQLIALKTCSTSINRYFAINYSHFHKGKINFTALKFQIKIHRSNFKRSF